LVSIIAFNLFYFFEELLIMVKYMIALDGSKATDIEIHFALKIMDKNQDELYLLSCTERITHMFPTAPSYFATITDAQKIMELETERLLKKYGKYCQEQGIKHVFAVRGTAPHIGELICQAVDKKSIDVLIIGRRGISGIKRIFLGSTSRYCAENASCNVLVVKEEAEKKFVENEEKQRLLKERDQEEEQEEKNRVAEHIGVIIEEEEERKRRIIEDRIIEDRIFHVENFPYEALPHIEDYQINTK